MSADGRAVARAFYDAVNDGRLAEALGLLSEDVRWSRPPDVPVRGTIEGVGEVERMWRAFTGSLDSFEIVPKGLEARGERVLATITIRGSSPEGGEFEFGGAQVFRIAAGRIAEVWEFRGLPEARELLAGSAPDPARDPATRAARLHPPPPRREREYGSRTDPAGS